MTWEEMYNHALEVIKELNEEIIVAFPNGDHWRAPEVDTMSVEIQKAFGKLEQDLMRK